MLQGTMCAIMATASYDHTIRLWDANTTNCIHTFSHKISQVNMITLTPTIKYIVAAGNPSVSFYSIDTLSQDASFSFKGHQGNVTSIGFQKYQEWMYTCSEDKIVGIWDLRLSECVQNYQHKYSITCATLNPDQSELFVGSEHGMVSIINIVTGKMSNIFLPETSDIRSISINLEGDKCVCVNNNGKCFVYALPISDLSAMHLEKNFQAHETYILKAVFSPDSKLLATASADTTVKIWDTSSWEKKKTLSGHKQWVWDCAFSVNSEYLLSGASDMVARLWSLEQAETIRCYSGHTGNISSVIFYDNFLTLT